MKALIVVVFLTELALIRAFPASPSEVYPYSEPIVNGSYILYWKHNDTHITFETHVKTLGWIGLGISGNGDMYPADVAIGWVKNGVAFLEDHHTIGYRTPIKDNIQNWHLISGRETGDTTVLKFVRAIDTCDADDDKPITKDLMHLIYAWGDSDPNPYPAKHTEKGARLTYLLDPITQNFTPPPDAKSFLFSSSRATVPPQLTYYHCTVFEFPTQPSKQHAIAFEPVVEPGNEDIVHHSVIMVCSQPLSSSDNGTSYDCTAQNKNNNVPKRFQSCYNIFAAWATGGKNFYLPDNVGMTIGDSTGPRYYVFQVHYNNPKLQQGRVDSSGIRVIYTPTLREHDAGMLETGLQISPTHVIPPGYQAFASSGYCPMDCLSAGMEDGNPIYITSVFLHSHLLGRKLRLRHIRDGVELKPISVDNNYDFDFQQTRQLRTPVMVKPTDTLLMECIYDSSKEVNATRGGLGTDEEMCVAFVTYYPRMPRVNLCFSTPTYNAGQDRTKMYREANKLIAEKDWKSWSDRLEFQCLVDGSDQLFVCVGNGYQRGWFAPAPKIDRPYFAESTCPGVAANPQSDYICPIPSAATAKYVAGFLIVASFIMAFI